LPTSKTFTLVCRCRVGPQNNPRFGNEGPRPRQPVDTSDDTGNGSLQHRNGSISVLYYYYYYDYCYDYFVLLLSVA